MTQQEFRDAVKLYVNEYKGDLRAWEYLNMTRQDYIDMIYASFERGIKL